MAGTATKVPVSTLVTLPTWMAVKGVKRAHVTVKKATSWLEPRFISSAVSRSQAGLEDLTVKEGILAFGHAAVVTFGALTDNVLEYMQDSTTPALIASAVQKEGRITYLEREIVTGQFERNAALTGRSQAMLAFAVVHEELQRHIALRQHRAQAAMYEEDPPSMMIGANPLFTDAADPSTNAFSSAQAQPASDEASPSRDQDFMNTLLTHKEMYESLPFANAEEMYIPFSPDFLDSAQPLPMSTHSTSDSTTLSGPQVVPREFSPTPQSSTLQDLRAMVVSMPLQRDPSVLAADPDSSVGFTGADAQMGWSVQTTQDDTIDDSWALTLPGNAPSFGGFLLSMSNNQSASDRSDSRDSLTSTSTTQASSSPRSTLPALRMHCPLQKLSLLSNRIPLSEASSADSLVPDISNGALPKSPAPRTTFSLLTVHTKDQATQTSGDSNAGDPSQPQQQQSTRKARVQKMPAAARGVSSPGAANSPASELTRRPQKSPAPIKSPIWK